jgi:hypothetical protein
MRTGLLAKKIGMTRIFRDNGEMVPVSVLHVDGCFVGVKTQEKDGYTAVQLAAGPRRAKTVSKAMLGQFRESESRAAPESRLSSALQKTVCWKLALNCRLLISLPASGSTLQASRPVKVSPVRSSVTASAVCARHTVCRFRTVRTVPQVSVKIR